MAFSTKYIFDYSKTELLKFFTQDLTFRSGIKPHTLIIDNHDQLNQHPLDEKYASELSNFILSFEHVVKAPSVAGVLCENAFFISSSVPSEKSDYFLADNEFAHIHGDSHSLHLVLPEDVAKIAVDKGWIENHPDVKKGKMQKSVFLLFGARNSEELEISKNLIYISYLFATKQW